ncbi:hypothetical protein ABIB00_004794 [Bradyrhizobium sp. LB14.3]|uniref:KilA-N domain-containing protein n=1 Tax=Bradyrhizobium sp. LB14.3 TaxID=3156328 RepID=UPI00339A1C85
MGRAEARSLSSASPAPRDGYVNATAVCQAAGREFKHYNENKTTKDFVAALSAEVRIPASGLIQIMKGGDIRIQGSWVHPQVAIHLAQWLSVKFAVQVSHWVYGLHAAGALVPDISHGKMFCKWLCDVHGIDTDALPTYRHVYEDRSKGLAES